MTDGLPCERRALKTTSTAEKTTLQMAYKKGHMDCVCLLERSTASVSAILCVLEKHHLPVELKMRVFLILDAMFMIQAMDYDTAKDSEDGEEYSGSEEDDGEEYSGSEEDDG